MAPWRLATSRNERELVRRNLHHHFDHNGLNFAVKACIVIMLRRLKIFGMAQADADLSEEGAPTFDAAVPMLLQTCPAA